MGREPEFYQKWVGTLFDGLTLCYPDDTNWTTGEKISEKDRMVIAEVTKRNSRLRKRRLITAASKPLDPVGPDTGKETIIKIRLQ